MRVLVTGVGGCLGRFVAGDLTRRGFEVLAVYRHRAPPPFEGVSPVLLRADLTEGDGLPDRYDAVVHAAATSPAGGVTADAVVRDNVEGTRRLIAHARGAGASAFELCSSVSTFGTVLDAVIDESTPVRDPDLYGMTKLLGEAMLAAASDRLAGLSVRIPALLGPGAQRNFVASSAARLLAGEPVTIFNPEGPFNNAAHSADLSALIATVLENGWRGYDMVVAAAAGQTTIRGVVERLRDRLGSRSEIRVNDAGNRASFTLSSARAIARYGYAPAEIGAMLDRFAAEVLQNAASAPRATMGRVDDKG
jgi:nucleoside-diphosphate-sugar epimerase